LAKSSWGEGNESIEEPQPPRTQCGERNRVASEAVEVAERRAKEREEFNGREESSNDAECWPRGRPGEEVAETREEQ
jgi:hypothetical protein